MLLRLPVADAHKRGVPPNPQIALEIRQWLVAVIAEKGWSPALWAKKAGVAASTVQRALKPTYEFVTSSRTLAKLAAVANVTPPRFDDTRKAQLVPHFLVVRYSVQAGHWFETEYDENTALGTFPVAPDPRYGNWPQWLERVVGDSVNLKMPSGSYAHVVDSIEMGYSPRQDDFVVVERCRQQGALRERTIKQVHINDGRVELWPRSTSPKWSSPVIISEGVRPGEDIEAEVVGLVIGAYLDFSRDK